MPAAWPAPTATVVAPSRPCAASTSMSPKARSSAFSDRTEPARRPPSGCSRRCSPRPAVRPRWPAPTCSDSRPRSVGGSATSPRAAPPGARAGEEVIDHALLYGETKAAARARGQELFGQLELDGLWDRKCSTLSGGQRRRLDIVMGLIHTPPLVFLDEPTTGLDPQARVNLWGHIRALRDERGSTVFLTTHYLEEADALCDRILIIDNGTIVAAGTPEELKRQVSGDAII